VTSICCISRPNEGFKAISIPGRFGRSWRAKVSRRFQHSMLDVECSMFPPQNSNIEHPTSNVQFRMKADDYRAFVDPTSRQASHLSNCWW